MIQLRRKRNVDRGDFPCRWRRKEGARRILEAKGKEKEGVIGASACRGKVRKGGKKRTKIARYAVGRRRVIDRRDFQLSSPPPWALTLES